MVSPGTAALSHSFHLSRSPAWISDNCATDLEMLHPHASAPMTGAYRAVRHAATLKFACARVCPHSRTVPVRSPTRHCLNVLQPGRAGAVFECATQVVAATRRSESRYRPFWALGFCLGVTWASSPGFNRAGYQPSHFRPTNRVEHGLGVGAGATVRCCTVRFSRAEGPSCYSLGRSAQRAAPGYPRRDFQSPARAGHRAAFLAEVTRSSQSASTHTTPFSR